jgi:signal transduction histidine kinase
MTSLERIHLAQELHDGIAQDLVAIGYSLDALLAKPDASTASKREIRRLRFLISTIIEKVRDEMFDLRNTPASTFAHDIELQAQSLLIPFTLEQSQYTSMWVDTDLRRIQIHKIVREIFRNIAEHSKASNVSVILKSTSQNFTLIVSDDGIGGVSEANFGMGLLGAFERAVATGTTISYSSDLSGTTFTVESSYDQ